MWNSSSIWLPWPFWRISSPAIGRMFWMRRPDCRVDQVNGSPRIMPHRARKISC
ncbi:hypothetical protein ACFQYP_12280 [Nonomuraea antimicrobica]